MDQINLVVDPSSSLTKAFYYEAPNQLELYTQEPEVTFVTKEGIEQYEAQNFGSQSIWQSSWLRRSNEYIAVGALARDGFDSPESLRELKFERAIYKMLALVGCLAVQKQLPPKLTLNLGMLLPYGEYQDRLRLRQSLTTALNRFQFQRTSYQVKLQFFNCLPEGAGVYFRGSDRSCDPCRKVVLVVILGYRNASYLLLKYGRFAEGQTTGLGFHRLLEKVVAATSGLTARQLLEPLAQAGANLNETSLAPLVQASTLAHQRRELKTLKKVIVGAREQSWKEVSEWLKSRRFPPIDEVILTGGTAAYYRQELTQIFAEIPIINWGNFLEERVRELLESEQQAKFNYRLTDLFGYTQQFQYLQRNCELGLA